MRTFILSLMILSVTFILSTKAFANSADEQHKIDYLLNTVATSGLIFIRDGTEYSGEEAKSHLQQKLNMAGDTIHTADDFINAIGSQSSITGTPYYVRLKDGRQIETRQWMYDVLSKMEIWQ